MKTKTTRKNVIAASYKLRSAGYCDLQFLLRGHEATAYTSGVYGWNFDVFNVYGLTICTGYRGMPGERLERVEEYENKAAAIWHDCKMPYEQQEAASEALLKEFCILNGGDD